MHGPDRHFGNEIGGPRMAGGLRALAARRRTLALLALASLLAVLVLSESSPADSAGSSVQVGKARARAAEAAPVGVVEPEGQEAAFIAPEGAMGIHDGRFGSSVALSGDGDTALIGAPYEDGGPEQDHGPGSAWVVTRTGGQWNTAATELAMPSADMAPEACGQETPEEAEEEKASEEVAHACRFGISVALSESGETAVIGAPHAHDNSGAVFIFTRSGSEWSLAKELTSPDPQVETRFGRSVAVSAAGTTVLVGAPMLDGRVCVFSGSGSEWSLTNELTSPAKSGAGGTGTGLFGGGHEGEGEGKGLFGQSVALSADGQTALVGAPGYPGQKGAAWIVHDFGHGQAPTDTRLEVRAGPERAGETEVEKKAREGQEETEARFGSSVALSGDGETAIVGAPRYEGDRGTAWVFAGSDAWSEMDALSGEEPADQEGQFGRAVALSYDGSIALAGAARSDEHQGTVWRFERFTDVSWGRPTPLQEMGVKRAPAQFGTGVALSYNAETALVGGSSAEHVGEAWVFGRHPAIYGVKPNKGPVTGGTAVTIKGEHLSEATAVRFGAAEATDVSVAPNGRSLTAVSPPGAGAGEVQISIETPVGASASEPADRFTYDAESSDENNDSQGNSGNQSNNGAGKEESSSSNGSASQTPKSGVLPFGPFASGACSGLPVGKRFSVNSHGRALVKLRGTGAGRCAGKLTLRVKIAQSVAIGHKRAYRLRAIGTVSFAIGAAQTRTFAIKLNAAGRTLLRAGHGRLNTSLLIVSSSPPPARARSASVRLTQLRPTKSGATKP